MGSANRKGQDMKNDEGTPPGASHPSPFMDPVALSHALLSAYERCQPLIAQFMDKYGRDIENQPLDPFNVRQSLFHFWELLQENPDQFIQMQSEFMQSWLELWQDSMLRFLDEGTKDNDNPAENRKGPANDIIQADPKDRRFRAAEWQESAVFEFIKNSYLLTSQWALKTIHNTDGLSDDERKKLEFFTQLYVDALSPSNFVLTNPQVLKETLESGGQNLVKGFENLMQDLERGAGDLAISTTDYKAFELGKNIAVTPGKVVYQNDLIQLIQYEPVTEKVYKTPLLIIPPWINKYYILDLQPKNSYIKWCVEQGFTVFTISWVNPDASLAGKTFDDYMDEGVMAALNQVLALTGEKSAHIAGYCLGGTLLTMTLAYLHAKKPEMTDQIKSATFLTTLIDFEDAGDLKLFMDDEQIEMMDKGMAEKGIFEAKQLQRTFSLLRANDMIWSFVINNYLMGKEPFPFDLLYWNDDSTNMPSAMHSFYLHNMYKENRLAKAGGISLKDTPLNVKDIKTPAYFLSTKEDHIAPWKATYEGAKLLSGPVSFTLAASGHTAGVVNHPDKDKYCYWTSERLPKGSEDWLGQAKETKGSWWPHWKKWLINLSGERVLARPVKKGLEKAPGSYVKKKV